MSFHVGQTFGDYSVTALLGAGGMGRVFKVEHTLTGRTEAMKVLSAELATEIQVKRFEREMRSLAKLNHPNIAALHSAAHGDNQLVLFMEYIEGRTLESMFGEGRVELHTGVGYIKQVLLALGYAHQRGVVHRDVTPANVMVMGNGQVKLTDFGLSKSYGDSLLTNCGEILGSLPYLAPEQLKGTTQPDRRSDLYSVGAMLYEHLTGRKPFGEKRRLAPVLTDSEEAPQAPSQIESGLGAAWDEIIGRSLARDPACRYQSAEELLNAITQLEQPPPMADLPLPRLGTLGIGIAAFGGLILAVIASPALGGFRDAPPVPAPWERLHIAPPAFATVVTPHSAQTTAITPRRVARAVPRTVRNPAPEATAGQNVSEPKVKEAVAAPETEPAIAENPTPVANPTPVETPAPAKKGFWSKLNVFKRKGPN